MASTRHLTTLSRPFLNRLFSPKPLKTLKSRSQFSSMASNPTSKQVLVPVADGTEPMEAVITVSVLRRAGADVTVASAERKVDVEASWGVKLVADALVKEFVDRRFDLVALPGGMPGAATLRDCDDLEKIVKKHVADGKLFSAICAAPAVALGSWGLLKGLKATCYPSFMEKFSPEVIKVESRVVQDGHAITSRGPGTAIEFALALVEQLYGSKKAEEVAGPMLMRPVHGEEFQITEFNSVKWIVSSPPKILVPIANGSEEMETLMLIDILRRATANVTVASVEDKLEIVASRNVKIVADVLIEEAAKEQYDLIVLPGGLTGAQTFFSSEVLVNLLKKQAESNKIYGGICASPGLVLEPLGLLKGKKATGHPRTCNKLSDQSEVENRVVIDGNLITSRGPGTSMEFALAIVEKIFGRQKALDLAKTMVFIN